MFFWAQCFRGKRYICIRQNGLLKEYGRYHNITQIYNYRRWTCVYYFDPHVVIYIDVNISNMAQYSQIFRLERGEREPTRIWPEFTRHDSLTTRGTQKACKLAMLYMDPSNQLVFNCWQIGVVSLHTDAEFQINYSLSAIWYLDIGNSWAYLLKWRFQTSPHTDRP